MRAVLLAIVASLAFGSVAMARPSLWKMKCSDAERMVADHPGIAMNWAYSKKAGNLYRVYFPFVHACSMPRKNAPPWRHAIVKTLDNEQCDIGYICVEGIRATY